MTLRRTPRPTYGGWSESVWDDNECPVCGEEWKDCPGHEECPAELHDVWDGHRIDLYCEREKDHGGEHSDGGGEWAWGA